MPTFSALTIYAFGFTALIAGTNNFLSPSTALSTFDLPVSAFPALKGYCIATIMMGIYYMLAAYQQNKAFFVLTVPIRLFTYAMLWGQEGQWRLAGLWEAGGAILTCGALMVEMMDEKNKNV